MKDVSKILIQLCGLMIVSIVSGDLTDPFIWSVELPRFVFFVIAFYLILYVGEGGKI